VTCENDDDRINQPTLPKVLLSTGYCLYL